MLTIRPIEDSDLDTLFEHQSDPESSRMAAFPSRDREGYMAHMAKIRKDPNNIILAIENDGAIVGEILSWETDRIRKIGYWIGKEHWGKGIATEALAILVQDLTQRPLFAEVADHNAGSRKVLERNGFFAVTVNTVNDPLYGTIDLMLYCLDA